MLKSTTPQLIYLSVAIAFLTLVLLTQAHSIPQLLLKLILLLHVIFFIALIKKRSDLGELTGWNTLKSTYKSTMRRISPFPSRQPVFELPMYNSQMAEIRNLVRNGIISNRLRTNDDPWGDSEDKIQKTPIMSTKVSQFNQNFYDFKETYQPSEIRRSLNTMSYSPMQQDARRMSLRTSTRPFSDDPVEDMFYHTNSNKKETSNDSIYEKMNISKQKRAKLLNCIRTHINQVFKLSRNADSAISKMTQIIFRRRFSQDGGPNCLSLQSLTKIINDYKTNKTIAQQHFHSSRETISSKETIRAMEQLMRLFDNRPPQVDFTNRKSVFNFYLWHVRRMFNPTKIQVVSRESGYKQQRDVKFIMENRYKEVYYYILEQEDCQYNIQETFLFLFLEQPVKSSIGIVRNLVEIRKYQ